MSSVLLVQGGGSDEHTHTHSRVGRCQPLSYFDYVPIKLCDIGCYRPLPANPTKNICIEIKIIKSSTKTTAYSTKSNATT